MALLLAWGACVAAAAQPSSTPEPLERRAWDEARDRFRESGPVLWIGIPRRSLTFWHDAIRYAGCVDPGTTVTLNGSAVRVYPTGAFAGLAHLKPGINRLEFRAHRDGRVTRIVRRIERPAPARALPAEPLSIAGRSYMLPKDDADLLPGDAVRIRFRGSPGAMAWFRIGRSLKSYPMRELSVARGEAAQAGIYEGSHTVRPEDALNNDLVRVSLEQTRRGKTHRVDGEVPGRLTVLDPSNLRRVRVSEEGVGIFDDVRFSTRVATAPAGAALAVTGREGERLRVRLAKGVDGWIATDAVRANLRRESSESAGPVLGKVALTCDAASAATAAVLSLGLDSPRKGGIWSRPLPYHVEVSESGATLTLTVWGLRADRGDARNTGSEGATSRTLTGEVGSDSIVSTAVRLDPGGVPDKTVLSVNLGNDPLWGYKTEFAAGEMRLQVRRLPDRDTSREHPLRGLRICLDPGHGGADVGAIGAAGLCESDVNLEIARRLARLLETAGAETTMTRDEDRFVSVEDRLADARAKRADLFVSIHNNAVSLEEDPLRSRGARLFYYHGQGATLAGALAEACRGVDPRATEQVGARRRSYRLTRTLTEMPSVLVECAFLSNPEDEARLLDSAFLDTVSAALYNGIVAFLNPPRAAHGEPGSSGPSN